MGEAEPDRRLRQQLEVVPEREPLTELEALRIGRSSQNLARYRSLLRETSGAIGSIVVGSGYGAKSVALGTAELQAALALLIEREELFLASFNVKIERDL